MFLPPNVTASEIGFSRAPLQARHGTSRMYSSNRSRLVSLDASACRRSTYGITPSKVV